VKNESTIILSDAEVAASLKQTLDFFRSLGYLTHEEYRFLHPPSNSAFTPDLLQFLSFNYKFIQDYLRDEILDCEDIIFAKYVHGSNAIEGNSLSRLEVFEYVINNRSPAGKSENELLQTRNHFRARQYLDNYQGILNFLTEYRL
jgi:hypothetical protein